MSDKPEKIYADRDSMQLDIDGGYYCRHISAMTGEGLHGKSEIADELAWRDREIDRLRADLAKPSEWISVDDRLPEESGSYFVCLENNMVTEFNFSDIGAKPYWFKVGFGSEVEENKVTHWQPLPTPPRETP